MNTRTFREMNMEGRKERPERREPSLEAKGEARQNQTSAEPSPGMSEQTSDGVVDTVWAQIFARENLNRAVKRVEANQGAPGVDGMTVAELRPYLQAHWLELKASLEAESYRPAAVKRVAIPKAGGGERLLGIPTVVDRFLQQAIQQVLTPLFEPGFSAGSYGFRPGRSAHDAVKAAQGYIAEGYEWVVDIDLEKFFDRVNHDKLMARVGRVVKDRRVKALIRRYLASGVMVNGVVMETSEGTPQGGPLSPLLSNIMLDDLDKALEQRGHHFARYADDCNIYVRSKRAGERVMASVRRFLEQRLSLKVNAQQSAVDRAIRRKFLGFSFLKRKAETLVRIAKPSLERVKAKLREFTDRTGGGSLEEQVQRINGYTMGWTGYFRLADTPSVFAELDEWLRRRLRQLLWKRWKQPRTRQHNLVALGVPARTAHEASGSGKGPWRLSASPPVQQALSNAYWRGQGLLSLSERYVQLRSTG
jgi:RNA-directed DNA polymerase